jgi:hypothetical protein
MSLIETWLKILPNWVDFVNFLIDLVSLELYFPFAIAPPLYHAAKVGQLLHPQSYLKVYNVEQSIVVGMKKHICEF